MARSGYILLRFSVALFLLYAAQVVHADDSWGKITYYPFFTTLFPDYGGTEVPFALEIGDSHWSGIVQMGCSFESDGPNSNSAIVFGSIGGRLYTGAGYGYFVGFYPAYRCIVAKMNDPTATVWNMAIELGAESNFNIPFGIAISVAEIYHDILGPVGVLGSNFFYPNVILSFTYRIRPLF